MTQSPPAPADSVDDAPREGAGDRLARWLLRGTTVGLALSLLAHIIILIAAALIHVAGAGAGRGPEVGTGDFKMAVMTDAELSDLLAQDVSPASPALQQAELPAPSVDPTLSGPTAELPGIAADLGTVAEGLGGAGGDIAADGMGLGGAGAGGASFFGVEATGARIVYIVDISGSMLGEKLAATKIELIESISGLLEHMSFHVIFYSSDAYPIGGRSKWLDARDSGKSWAIRQIEDVSAQGGTVPWPAFAAAFAMRPRPDAIYFMTDGQFDSTVRDQIAYVNRGETRIPIHCISFVDPSAAELMRGIAEDSGGTYSHVDGPR